MERMTVRDKTYCEIQPAVWQRCEVPTVAMRIPPVGTTGTLLLLGVMAISTLAVVPQVIERRRQIHDEITELMEVTKK